MNDNIIIYYFFIKFFMLSLRTESSLFIAFFDRRIFSNIIKSVCGFFTSSLSRSRARVEPTYGNIYNDQETTTNTLLILLHLHHYYTRQFHAHYIIQIYNYSVQHLLIVLGEEKTIFTFIS